MQPKSPAAAGLFSAALAAALAAALSAGCTAPPPPEPPPPFRGVSVRVAGPPARAAFQKKYGRPPGPPATWEEFTDIAEFFSSAGGPALPPPPDSPDGPGREFYAVAACYARRALPPDERTQGDQLDDV